MQVIAGGTATLPVPYVSVAFLWAVSTVNLFKI